MGARPCNNMLAEMHNTYEHTRSGADAAAAAASQAPIWYRCEHFLVAVEPWEAAKLVTCKWQCTCVQLVGTEQVRAPPIKHCCSIVMQPNCLLYDYTWHPHMVLCSL